MVNYLKYLIKSLKYLQRYIYHQKIVKKLLMTLDNFDIYKMEYEKVNNLLDDNSKHYSKFKTKQVQV